VRGRRHRTGTVHLVGAGPGDPGLITRRGQDLLSRADVVVADALAAPGLLDLAPSTAERITAGKRGGRRSVRQETVNRLLIDRARRGLDVVRLKGGDPCLFGRGGEEAEALRRARVPFTVVPGVTAALGAAAWAGIPLTHRRHSSAVVLATGHSVPGRSAAGPDWEALARADTLVLYMGVRRLQGLVGRLLRAGMSGATPVALVRCATLPEQQVVVARLGEIVARAREAGVRPPALLIAGRVVRLRRGLDWVGRLPLHGRTIVVTRPRDQAGPFVDELRECGARVLLAPAIELRPPRSLAPLDRAIRRLTSYDFIVFTSVNGVARFFSRLLETRRDIRDLKGIDLLAIGPATASALEARGLRVEAVPEDYRAEGLVEMMTRRRLRGARVLLPRAAVARDLLVTGLRRRGAVVDVVPVYRTVASRDGSADVRDALRRGRLDLITFTSSSTVSSFARQFRGKEETRRIRSVPVAAIGPITAATARRERFRVVVMPRRSTVPDLTRAVVRYLRNSPSGTPRGS
jgi:uroporphyrinogen III methyltransferase/synthase